MRLWIGCMTMLVPIVGLLAYLMMSGLDESDRPVAFEVKVVVPEESPEMRDVKTIQDDSVNSRMRPRTHRATRSRGEITRYDVLQSRTRHKRAGRRFYVQK